MIAARGAGDRPGFLLLRRAGGLWGLANAEVQGLARRGGAYRVATAGGELAADEVVGVVPALALRPPARLLGRFWPEAAAGLALGLAVVGGEPVVVIDPRRPPRALVSGQDGDGGEAGQRSRDGDADRA